MELERAVSGANMGTGAGSAGDAKLSTLRLSTFEDALADPGERQRGVDHHGDAEGFGASIEPGGIREQQGVALPRRNGRRDQEDILLGTHPATVVGYEDGPHAGSVAPQEEVGRVER